MSDRVVAQVGGASLMHKAREAILDSILNKRFEDGRLPPEDELGEMLGVSRTTVRSALQSLEQHGVLTRTRGRGTVIQGHMSPAVLALQRLIDFARLLEEQGHEVETRIKITRSTRVPAEVTTALGTPEPAEYFLVDRLLKAGGQPAIWIVDFLPVKIFRSEPDPARLSGSPFAMGDLLAHGPIEYALVELVPSKATRTVVEHLRLKPSEAYLQLKEVLYSGADLAVGFSRIHVRDQFVRFQMYRGAVGR